MAGTPIWQIEEGIANAISANDPGVSPSARYEDYVGLAKTLTNEYQNYNTQSGKPGNQSVFDKYNIPTPEERYTVENFFPKAMASLAQIGKDNPLYKTGAVGSGAVLPPRVTGAAASAPTTGMDAQAILQKAQSAMNKAENFTTGGKTYTPEQLRDGVIKQLESDVKNQEKNTERLKVLQDKWKRQTRTQFDAAEKEWKAAGFDRNSYKAAAKARFESGGTQEEYRAELNQIEKEYKRKQDTYEKLKQEKNNAPTDLYTLLKETDKTYYDKQVAEGKLESNFSLPSKDGKPKYLPSASGPGGYVGPAGGESTMARTYDPYMMQIRQAVVPVLQERLDKSGRTPQMDALFRLAQSGLIGK
jgi:heat shock protein HspQ